MRNNNLGHATDGTGGSGPRTPVMDHGGHMAEGSCQMLP